MFSCIIPFKCSRDLVVCYSKYKCRIYRYLMNRLRQPYLVFLFTFTQLHRYIEEPRNPVLFIIIESSCFFSIIGLGFAVRNLSFDLPASLQIKCYESQSTNTKSIQSGHIIRCYIITYNIISPTERSHARLRPLKSTLSLLAGRVCFSMSVVWSMPNPSLSLAGHRYLRNACPTINY